MKKLLLLASFLAATTPTLAFGMPMQPSLSTANIIGNDVTVVAKSGDNSISGLTKTQTTVMPFFSKPMTMIMGGSMVQGITTGETIAVGSQYIEANSGICGMCRMPGMTFSDVLFNDVKVTANSGDNMVRGIVSTNTLVTGGFTGVTGGDLIQGITTGPASAQGDQWIITNVTSVPTMAN